jgi:ferredoxin
LRKLFLVFLIIILLSAFLVNGHGGYDDVHTTWDYGKIATHAIFLVSVVLFILLFKDKIGNKNGFKKSLSDNRIMNRIFRSRKYKLFLQIPTLFVFLGIIFLGFFDIQKSGWNLATILTWTIWWTFLIVFIVFLGRIWCTMCPAATLGDWAKKILNLKKKYPYFLRNSWLQTSLFIVLTLLFFIFEIGNSPFLTAVLLTILMLSAIIFGMIFERRTFCRYVCPIGSMIGVYSMFAPVELRNENGRVCFEHVEKDCYKGNKNSEGCSMLLYPGGLKENTNCNFCMDCYNACPKNNLSLNIRNFAKDLWMGAKKRVDEIFLVVFLLGITFVHTFFMLKYWKDMAMEAGFNNNLAFTLSFILVGLVLPIILFILAVFLSSRLSKKEKLIDVMKRYGMVFVPVALAMHLAHNLNHLFTESWSVVPAFKRLLSKMGIEKLNIVWSQKVWFNWYVLYTLQSLIILAGIYYAFKIAYISSKDIQNKKQALLSMLPFVVLALIISLVNVYVLGMPMMARQTH